MSLCRFRETEVVVAVVSVGSASERRHGARRSPERVSRRTRHPESASRRDTTIERRMRARSTRGALYASIRRAHRIVVAFSTWLFRRCRKSRAGRPGHRGSRSTSWSPRAPGGQPSARVRLRERATPWPRRDRDARARAYDSESAPRPGRAALPPPSVMLFVRTARLGFPAVARARRARYKSDATASEA